jgi:hypothetical protein
MSYQIDRFNGTIFSEIIDQTVDSTSCDLKLIGKNYAGYGEVQNENFLHLLENFRGVTSPRRPIIGQIWYDENSNNLKFRDLSNNWRSLTVTEVGDIPPTSLNARDAGNLWYDTLSEQINVWDGSEFITIGPENAPGFGTTKVSSTTIRDNGNTEFPILKVFVNDTVIATVSTTAFQIGEVETIPGFTQIKKGITLVDTNTSGKTTSDFKFWGSASDADTFAGLSISNFVLRDQNGVTFNDAGILIGTGNDLKLYVEDGNRPIIDNNNGTDIKIRITDEDKQTDFVFDDTAFYPADNELLNLGSLTSRWNVIYSREIRSNLVGNVTGNLTGNLTGNSVGLHRGNVQASDSTTAYDATTKTFFGSFSGNIIGNLSGQLTGNSVGSHKGNLLASDDIVTFDFNTKTFTGIFVGNASSASKLSTIITINGVEFDGTRNITVADDTRLLKTGGALSNFLTLHSNPVNNLHAATKQYVDNAVGSLTNAIENRPLAFSLDTRGLTNSTIATLLNTIAPPELYSAGQEARIAGTRQNLNVTSNKTPTTESESSTDPETGAVTTTTYVTGQSLTVTTSVTNPTRNNNLIFRVSNDRSTWQFVSG